MRCRVLAGITLLLWVYVLVGGAVFHLLESKHEDETINDTLDAFYDLLRKCKSWWRHQMEIVSALLAFCAGNAPVSDSPHKGQWRGVLMFSLICAWTNSSVNNGDLRRQRAHYDVTTMFRFSGPLFNEITSSYLYRIPIINLRRSSDRFRFIMGIPIPIGRRLFRESKLSWNEWKQWWICISLS